MENILFRDGHSSVVLADFGGSYFQHDNKIGRLIQSREYRSPEILLAAPYSEKIDIWSMGCIVFEVATRSVLFPPKWGDKLEKNQNHLRLMTQITGAFPHGFARSGQNSDQFFDQEGVLIGGTPARRSIAVVLKEDHGIEDFELVEFLTACLKIDPRFRPSAAELEEIYDYVRDKSQDVPLEEDPDDSEAPQDHDEL